ncbi:MAG: DUF559 domain-containing protein [Myxococcales bacterium]
MSSLEKRTKARRKLQLTERTQLMRRASTPSEQALWQAIRGRTLGVQFRRQVPIGGMSLPRANGPWNRRARERPLQTIVRFVSCCRCRYAPSHFGSP